MFLQWNKSASIVLLMVVVAGCATTQSKHKQCDDSDFIECLEVTSAQCDAMLYVANPECKKIISDNTMYENMPNKVKGHYHRRCLIESLIAQTNQPAEKIKSCLIW